jgi:hypothetical protein
MQVLLDKDLPRILVSSSSRSPASPSTQHVNRAEVTDKSYGIFRAYGFLVENMRQQFLMK